MKPIDAKPLADDIKALTSRSRSTGPRSPEGKLCSSLNSVRHGLAGRALVLPGESVDVYEARLSGVFEALAPADEAQAQIVALVADDLWKLQRLSRLEGAVILGRIEELLGDTPAAAQAAQTAEVLLTLGAALRAWEENPRPKERDEGLRRLVEEMRNAIDKVSETVTDLPGDGLAKCESLLVELFGKEEDKVLPEGLYDEAFSAAAQIMGLLLEKGDEAEDVQQKTREVVAQIAMPGESDLKKLARYRKTLEDSLQRRLQILEQLRKLGVAATSTEATDKARAYQVALRVVR